VRLGGRFRKGMALEYRESGALVEDDTMANGDEDDSVMLPFS